MTDQPKSEQTSASPFENLSNTELAVIRTDLAQNRTDMATERTDKSQYRTSMAETRTDLARERSRMAAERTLMAWIRTSLSMISFGFGIDRFFAYLNKTQTNTQLDVLSEERLLGLSFITLGTFGLIAAIITHWQTLKNIDRRNYNYTPKWSLTMVIAIVLAFIGLATYLPLISADVKLREVISLDSQVIRNFVSLTIFLIMLTIGINFSFSELLEVWKQRSLVVRSLLAACILVPAITLLGLFVLPLPTSVVIGLTLLAAAPGAPLLTKRVQMAGGNFNYGISLQVTLSLAAVLITPGILFIFGTIFPEAIATVDSLQVAKQISIVQLLPLSLGLTIRQFGADIADEISDFLRITANTAFVVLALILLILSLDLIPALGALTIVAIVLLAILFLGVGHVLGGPTSATRVVVAIACLARNAGLALFIAVLNQQTAAIPVILAYLVLAALTALPYSIWMRRQTDSLSTETQVI